MKLLELVLEAFGPFSGQRLDFSEGNQGFHLVYGDNEAGKSSVLSALESLFFSIQTPSLYTFVHPNKQQLRIHATLQRKDGVEWKVTRRCGRKNSLLDENGRPIPPDSFDEMFLGMDRHLFRRRFCLNHETLREGGEQLRLMKGDTGKALFSTALSGRAVHEVIGELDAEADKRFRPRGQKQIVNSTVAEFKKLKTEEKQLSISANQWKKLHRHISNLNKRKEELETGLSECLRKKERLVRIERSIPAVARLLAAHEKLEALGPLPPLPEDFSRDLPLLRKERSVAMAGLRRNEERIEEIRNAMESIEIPEAYLEEETRILHFSRQIGAHLKASEDRRKLRAQADLLRGEIERSRSRLLPELSVNDAQDLSMTPIQRKRVRSLGQRYQTLAERDALARRNLENLEIKGQRLQKKADAIGEIRETGELLHIIRDARRKGDLDRKIEELSGEVKADTERLLHDTQRLGLDAQNLENILDCPIPSGDRIQRYNVEFDALELSRKQCLSDLEKQNETLETVVKDIETLRLERDVPSESSLAEIRENRDGLWDEFLSKLEHSTGERIEVEALEDWAARFEPLVKQADVLADRLRREAERVARLAQFQAQKAMIEKAILRLETRRAELEEERRNLLENWRKLWESSGVDPLEPPDRVLWIAQYRELIDEVRDVAKRSENLNDLKTLRATCIESLQKHFEPTDSEATTGSAHLEYWLRRADAFVEECANLRQKKEHLEEDLESWQVEFSETKKQAAGTNEEFRRLKKEWKEAVAAIDPAGNIDVEHGLSILSDFEELETKTEKLDDLERRIQHIDNDEKALHSAVGDLCRDLAPELADSPVEQAVDRLAAMLKTAGRNREQLDALEKRERELLDDLEKDREAIGKVQAQIDDFCRLADCDENQLLEIDEKIRAHKDATVSVKTSEEQLLGLGWQGSREEIIEEVRHNDIDRCRAQISEISNEIERLEKERSELLVEIGDQGRLLATMEGTTGVAELRFESETKLATIRRQSERYLHYRLAKTILEKGIERFREKHQSPVLKRAGELFEIFTCGSFGELRSDYFGSENPELIGVRPSGEKVAVEGMSQGTRDQLYLALRLAHLETRLENGEALPFIVDDIMIHFDDERAKAALSELGRLSDRTQVLFFTHHRRLVDIARASIDSKRLFLSTLDENL